MRISYILLSLLILGAGQQTPASPPTGSVDTHLRPHVERLYLNYKQLQEIHKDLHDIAITSFQGPEKQSSYIRQTNLFISEANLMCWSQWELLSMTTFIKDEHKIDFYTLRSRDLRTVITESNHRIHLLKLYSGYIRNQKALESIDTAIGIIEGNVYLFETVTELLQPLIHPPNTYNQHIN
jgi:hypothetical protein